MNFLLCCSKLWNWKFQRQQQQRVFPETMSLSDLAVNSFHWDSFFSKSLLIFSWLVIWSGECQQIIKNGHHNFPDPKGTSYNILSSPQPKDIQFIIIKENHKIFSFQKLEPEVLPFLLKELNNHSYQLMFCWSTSGLTVSALNKAACVDTTRGKWKNSLFVCANWRLSWTVCSSAAAVGTTRARPSQHSQAAEPPPPAIAPQSALNQSLIQQQNGNTQSLYLDHICQKLFKSTCLSF